MERDRKALVELSTRDRDLILRHVILFFPGLRDKIKSKRARDGAVSLRLTLEELSDLTGCIAREANHTSNGKLEGELDPLFLYLDEIADELR